MGFRWPLIGVCLAGLIIIPVAYWKLDQCVVSSFSEHAKEHGDITFLSDVGLFLDTVLKISSAWVFYLALLNLPNGFPSDENQAREKGIGFTGGSAGFLTNIFYFYTRPDQEAMFPLSDAIERHNGLHPKVLEKAFEGKNEFAIRIIKVLVLIAKAALVTFTMVFNYTSLPHRDPRQPLNEARYRVVYVELAVLAWLYGRLVVQSVGRTCVVRDVGSLGSSLAEALERVAEWSSLQMLRSLSVPFTATVILEKMENSKILFNPKAVYFYGAVLSLCAGAIGISGIPVLAVKSTQIDFVQTKLYSDYTVSEIIRLAGFAVAVAGVFDVGDVSKLAIKRFLVTNFDFVLSLSNNPSPIWQAWEKLLAKNLSEHPKYGPLSSFIIMATLDVSDMRKLLLQQEYAPSDLLKELLTSDREPRIATDSLWFQTFAKNVEERRAKARNYLQSMPGESRPLADESPQAGAELSAYTQVADSPREDRD